MVELQHGHNFRDIGGYRAGSRTTRWGCVYRSGSLAWLSDADQDQLQTRGISAICDLRSDAERLSRPSRIQRLQPAVHWWHEHPGSVANLTQAARRQGVSADTMRDMMIGFYRELPFEQAASLGRIYRMIAEGSVPLIVHCSVGKDRTGVAIALLLSLVGVERDMILEDYLLTEVVFEKTRAMVIRDSIEYGLAPADARVWEPMLRADPVYLQAMFEAVVARCGSLESYFAQYLQLDAGSRDAIAHRLTG